MVYIVDMWVTPSGVTDEFLPTAPLTPRIYARLNDGTTLVYNGVYRDFMGAWPRRTKEFSIEASWPQWPMDIGQPSRARIHEQMNRVIEFYACSPLPEKSWAEVLASFRKVVA